MFGCVNYLGVTLGSSAKVNINNRVAGGRKSLYCLQESGLCFGGTHQDTVRYIRKAPIRPVVTYGLQSINVSGKDMDSIEGHNPNY